MLQSQDGQSKSSVIPKNQTTPIRSPSGALAEGKLSSSLNVESWRHIDVARTDLTWRR